MKRKHYYILSTLALCIVCYGFSYEWRDDERTNYTPILMSYGDLTKSIESVPAKEIEQAGKITIFQSNIFIVDKYKGVHIFDNSEIGFPKPAGFIQIPGCMDISIKNNVLFADNSVDLVSIDLKEFPKITVLDRVKYVFPEPLPPDLDYIPSQYTSKNRPNDTVIIEWVQ